MGKVFTSPTVGKSFVNNVEVKLSGSCYKRSNKSGDNDVKIRPKKDVYKYKYGCPVCLAMGAFTAALTRQSSCSVCGVQFEWEGLI